MAAGQTATLESLILAGGQATRLLPLELDQLKPLVCLEGVPLLQWLVHWLQPVAKRVVIAVGQKRQRIAPIIRSDVDYFDDAELGTGAAVLAYVAQSQADELLICNADTINDLPIAAMCEAHAKRGHGATLALTRATNVQNCSAFAVTGDGRILRSLEDMQPKGRKLRLVEWFGSSTGVMIIPTSALRLLSGSLVSLEQQIIPELIDSVGVYAYDNMTRLSLDIGTPDRLRTVLRYEKEFARILDENVRVARHAAAARDALRSGLRAPT